MNTQTNNELDVEIVVPAYNEERVLEASILRLHGYLSANFPFSWRITIADNASTDNTLAVAHRLADEFSGVEVMHLSSKGRGRALRIAWSASPAQVVAYMDVDLSTDLAGLLPLVAPLLSGHSELAIGTRLAAGSRVSRGPKRELISRSYNKLLRSTLNAHFSDAQCGFKAIRSDVAHGLLPQVKDQEWFFDTELLILAQRQGLRIHEVPVDWVDDPDSRVAIVSTAFQDLRGVARLAWESNVVRFLLVGIASTIAYALLFLVMRPALGAVGANFAALAITAIGNTAMNRHFTFGVEGRAGIVRQYLAGVGIFLLTLALTNGVLYALEVADPNAAPWLELTVLTIANVAATCTRYVALRFHVFAHGRRVPQGRPSPAQQNSSAAAPAELLKPQPEKV
jgi:glycosyltransferase involved in cell wall biosynthesis